MGVTVLAICLDAAEAGLVRRLADAGELPEIASLIRAGTWSTIPADVASGSGGLWPTFLSGRPASEHGVYGEWAWDPHEMRMRRPEIAALARLDRGFDETLGMFGVPTAWPTGRTAGFEVIDWGNHDRWAGDPARR